MLSLFYHYVTRGKIIAVETEQLDSVMFGSPRGPAHPVTMTISQLETRVNQAKRVLSGLAAPRLSQHRDCLSFHLLKHRCDTLTSALRTLTSNVSQLPPIGHSLSSANPTLQEYTENSQRLEVGVWVNFKNGPNLYYTCI